MPKYQTTCFVIKTFTKIIEAENETQAERKAHDETENYCWGKDGVTYSPPNGWEGNDENINGFSIEEITVEAAE